MPQGHHLNGIAASDSLVVAVGSGGILVSEDAENWEIVHSDRSLNDVIWTGDQFVAVGLGGIIMTSADGYEWTVRHFSGLEYFNRVIFNGDIFLAVGVWGVTATSPDGINWTDHVVEQPYPNGMRDVAWNGTTFVTVGGPNSFGGTMDIFYSEDGAHWSVADVDDLLPREFFCIVWGHDRFLAFDALMGSILSSVDGQNWIEESTNISGLFLEVLAVPGGLLGVGGGGKVFESADGMSWTASTALPSLRDLWDLTFFQDKYVAVGEDGAIIVSADYGQQWDVVTTWEIEIHSSDQIVDLCWANGIIIAISNGGGVFRSLDGLDWELVTGYPARLTSIKWANEAFWLVGYEGLIATSDDGAIWDTRNFGSSVRYLDITTDGEVLVAVGTRSDQIGATVATSEDGYAWNQFEIDGAVGVTMRSATWTGSRFVGVGSGGSFFRSDDGLQWEVEFLDPAWSMKSVASNGSVLVAVGVVDFLISDDNGLTWSSTLPQQSADDVIWTGERFVAAGGREIHSSRNGHDWVSSDVGLSGTASHISSNGREIVFSGSWANLMRAKLINILPPPGAVEEPVLD